MRSKGLTKDHSRRLTEIEITLEWLINITLEEGFIDDEIIEKYLEE